MEQVNTYNKPEYKLFRLQFLHRSLLFMKPSEQMTVNKVQDVINMDSNIKKVTDKVVGSVLYPQEFQNISKSERIVSSAFGAFMVWRGLKDLFHKPSNSVWELILGAGLIYRGATGYCAVKDTLETTQEGAPTVMEEEYIVEAM